MPGATARALDMTDVKDGGEFQTGRVPSGDYLAKIVKVVDAEVKSGDNAGTAQWVFTIVLEKYKSRKYPYRCTLAPNQLWKVRNLCTAVGLVVPKKKVKIDPNKLLNKLVAVTMEDDEYKGREQSVVAAVFPASELEPQDAEDIDDEADDEDEDVEETPAPKAKRKPTPPPADEDEDEDEDDEEATDDEDEEGEEEPPPPPRKKTAAKKVAARKSKDDELDELDLDDI